MTGTFLDGYFSSDKITMQKIKASKRTSSSKGHKRTKRHKRGTVKQLINIVIVNANFEILISNILFILAVQKQRLKGWLLRTIVCI